jgi:hypothetical protein
VTSWSEQRNKYAIIADHRLAGSRDVDVHGGRDSTLSMGVIVAGIIRRRVGRLSNAAMRAWAPRQERGRRNQRSEVTLPTNHGNFVHQQNRYGR